MALTTAQIQRAYVAFFNRPADVPGLNYWLQFNGTLSNLYASFAQQPEYAAQFDGLSNANKVNVVYENLLSRSPDLEGLEYWTLQLDTGAVTLDQLTLFVANGAQGADIETLQNKVAAATAFTDAMDSTDEVLAYSGDDAFAAAREWMNNITNDASLAAALQPAALDAAVAAVVAAATDNGGVVTTFTLTAGQDVAVGNNLDNSFKANVVQNDLGAQVNTLGSGDELYGQGGTDTLNAKITAGAFINGGGGATMPIQPETTGIEIVNLQAVNSRIDDGRTTEVYVNAKDMTDVEQLWSLRSDANLTIQNLTTVGLNKLSDMTIGMAYTGNADSDWEESDMTVYFDQDYLTPEATRTNPVVEFLAMNEDNYDATNGAKPLDGVFFRELQFRLNGETFNLRPYLNEDPLGSGSEITTYAEFETAVKAALVELKADNLGNAALQTVQASLSGTFTTDANPDTLVLREGQALALTVAGLTNGVANILDVQSTDLEVARAAGAIVPNNNRYELADASPATEGGVLAINVALEKVGLAGDGGELIIGSMNKTTDNEWNDVTTVTDTTSGIKEFYVTVYGDNDKSSSLSGLHSTNNNLRVVTVDTDAALTGTSFADLTIGNSNTTGGNAGALKDVQTFDASGFKGDLSLMAALTSEVVAKYLDLKDTAAPAADNVAFEYTGGTGDDSFDLTLSAANLAAAGTATREDMTVNVDGGAGDDMITLAIVDSSGPYTSNDSAGLALVTPLNGTVNPIFGSGYANWYDNQKLNANLSIDGGEGNDTIWTPGSGDVVINGDAGDDTVYADNTGANAAWAFNVAGTISSRFMLNNLQSDVNNSYKLFETDVVVTFKGLVVKAAIADKSGVATDLDINQAIKKAINSDPVLSTLLEAKDGPANTLVVTSLIDGGMAGDLSIGLEGPKAADLSAGDVNQLITWYGSSFAGTTAAGFESYFAGQITTFDTKADYAANFAHDISDASITGGNSLHTSDNTITGGTGDDVIVMGTGAYSNDTAVYAAAFGNDVIVNFEKGSSTVFTNTVATPAARETFTVDFATLTRVDTTTATTVTFDGQAINLSVVAPAQTLLPAVDVANEVFQTWNNAAVGTLSGTAWTASHVAGSTKVTFTANDTPISGARNIDMDSVAAGDQDVTAANFVFTNTVAANGGVVISNYVDGLATYAAPGAAKFTLDFDATTTSNALAAGTFAFTYDLDGSALTPNTVVNIAYAAGDGPLTLANKFAAAVNAGSDWSAVVDGTGRVTATAKVPGLLDLDTQVWPQNATEIAAEITNGVYIVLDSTASFENDGTAQAGLATITTATGYAGTDYLDFTGIGGDITADYSNFNSLSAAKSVVVAAQTTSNDTAAEIAALFTNAATATTHVYVAYTTGNVGNVYQVVDATGTTAANVATLMGTIDMADTQWSSLTAVNFV